MGNWRRWVGAIIVVYGLFIVLVGLVGNPGNVGMTVALVIIGAIVAAVGWLFAWRSVRLHPR